MALSVEDRFILLDSQCKLAGFAAQWELLKLWHWAEKYRADQLRVLAGNDGGGQFEYEGRDRALVQPAFFDPRREAARRTVELALALFTWLSARNASNQQAVLDFNARQYGSDGTGAIDPSNVKSLTRAQVDEACPRLNEVQARTDLAAERVGGMGRALPPSQYGTAVHYGLSQQIKDLKDPNFRAEVSILKTDAETYGTKDSIRVDVLERVGDGTVCVYDIKTGRSVLTPGRMAEISGRVLNIYRDTTRMIVTEVRPGK